LYGEQSRRIPDPNDRLEACYRAVIAAVREQMMSSGDRLAIGGKSMGGRIASQVAAAGIEDLAGLVFLGYPLHPPGRPDRLRAAHLPDIKAPMLFVQGARDAFGTPEELRAIMTRLEPSPALYVVAGGDHSFKVPKRSDVTQEDVHRAIQDHVAAWLREQVAVRTTR
jgi:predicted alpha/beta-hydrolase family hydrolase